MRQVTLQFDRDQLAQDNWHDPLTAADLREEFAAAMADCPECDEDFGETASEMDGYYAGME